MKTATIDNPASDRDAFVKSLSIFLYNKIQILSDIIKEKESNFLNNQRYVNEPTIRE